MRTNDILINENSSPYMKRLVLMKRAGIRLTNKQKKRLNESVSMVEIPKNRTQLVPKKPIQEPNEDEIDLEEILREMGYYEDEVEEDDIISNMSRDELKELVRDVVEETLEEEDDINEIIENLIKRDFT
jgi:hypothetical protein